MIILNVYYIYVICDFPPPPSRQLIAHLNVFAKFANPRSLYMESSLRELYNQVILKISHLFLFVCF